VAIVVAAACAAAAAGANLMGGGSAGAGTVSGVVPQVGCVSSVGTQPTDIPFAISAPDQVHEHTTFTVTFPGGTGTLPSTALGGLVTIQQFTDLSTTYQIDGATFVPGTIQSLGDTVNNGTVVEGTAELLNGDTQIRFTTPGPVFPGTLETPDRLVDALAPAAGTPVELYVIGLTTTAWIGATPPGSPVAVTCTVSYADVQAAGGVLGVEVVDESVVISTTTAAPTTSTSTSTTTTLAPSTTTTAPTAPPQLLYSLPKAAREGNATPITLKIPLILDRAAKDTIVVRVVSTTNGTAKPGEDFQPVDTLVTFSPKQKQRVVEVLTIPDAVVEGGVQQVEFVRLRATIVSGNVVFANGLSALAMSGVILDDDFPY
jgi:hypothetical protein